MIGDKGKFTKIDNLHGGFVRFGNNSSINIKGKGTLSIYGKSPTHNVYYVDGLKYNPLSVSHMCDNGYHTIFYSKGCEVRKEMTRKMSTVEGKTTYGNFYHLKYIQRTHCMIGQVDVNWLWHRRLDHLNFDNLVNVSTKGCVRHLPKLKKPKNYICKECQKRK